ncbi:Yos1-like protein [Hypoxylon argillaceum]|nr:Yos1-like protein [Hypoxylon argillaceum]
MMLIGNLIYVLVLITNALAILSEDRFLARSTSSHPSPSLPNRLANELTPAAVNFSSAAYDPAFGTGPDTQSIRAKAINLLASVRTLMRIPLILTNTLIIIYELVLG